MFHPPELGGALRFCFWRLRHNTGEIYDAVTKGGFLFDAANATNAMTGMRQLMTKNSNQFHKLPNGAWGLTSWYENIKVVKTKPQDVVEENNEAEDEESSTASK